MSTRSHLRFVRRPDADDTTDRVAQVYRHSDGYPESVLRDLARLRDLLQATRTERGPAYTAAAFVFLDKLTTLDLYLDGDPDRTVDAAEPGDVVDPATMTHLDQPLFLLGHGVEDPRDGIHGDEAYLYVVEVPARSTVDEPAEWTVNVSEYGGFPRWDGPTDEAFERATWQFEGPLDTALAELVADAG